MAFTLSGHYSHGYKDNIKSMNVFTDYIKTFDGAKHKRKFKILEY